MGYYGKEKEPKGVKSSDSTGEKKVRVSKMDSEMKDAYPSTTGAKAPKAALSSDTTGERKERITGGVAQGKADSIGSRDDSHMGKVDGRLGEMKGYVGEKVVYDHKRG